MHKKEQEMATKFFIPDWVLSSRDLTPGAKLILSVLSTRSTETKEGRTSFGMGVGAIADLVGMHYVSVDRLVKQLSKEGYMKSIKGGYLLIGEPDKSSEETTDAPAAPAEEATEEPATTDVAPQAPEAYQPRNLLQGCYTWEECVTCLTGKSICVADLAYSYDNVLDSAPFKGSLFKYMQACRASVEKRGGSVTDLFVAEKKKG